MLIKNLNSYRIAHENGNLEEINAENMIEALENLNIAENYSPVIQISLDRKNIKTIVSENLPDVEWTSEVSPEEAGTAGAVAFPASGKVEAKSSLSLIAVEAEGYTFDHWERNNVTVGTEKILETIVEPLAEGETECIYVAVFTANE